MMRARKACSSLNRATRGTICRSPIGEIGRNMSDSPHIFDVNESNFEQIVIQGSQQRPVLVDFWASWCQPCQMLMPTLARLAEEYAGRFILAKLNTEENQSIATHYGIRSIPNVKLFVGGREVDEFAGALPESAIRDFLDKHIPRESDSEVEAALQAFADGDSAEALSLLQQARQSDPGNTRIALAMAQIHAAAGDPAAAEAVLDSLPAGEQDSAEVSALRSQLLFAKDAPQPGELESLRARIADNPKDSEAGYKLAMAQVQAGDYASALDQLLALMASDRDYKDGAARQALLRLFDLLGDDPLVAQARRRLFNLMH